MNTTEVIAIAMTIIFTVRWLIWRVAPTDSLASLVAP